MVSSVEEVSILRIMGRDGAVTLAAALAAAAALTLALTPTLTLTLKVLTLALSSLKLEAPPGTRGEKLPGALAWDRDGCMV
jgi:6-phosphofructokinase